MTDRLITADANHRDWGQLNAHLLECVMAKLARSGVGSSLAFKDMLRAAGVCHHWRSVGSAALLHDSSWHRQATIRHPAQLSTLCPLASAPGGLIKGQVRREACGWGLTGRLQRLIFYQTLHSSTGEAGVCGKFLLAAEQQGSGDWAVYIDRKCRGKPIAHLTCNALRTMYTLTAGGSSFHCSCSCCNSTALDRSSSSSITSSSSSRGCCDSTSTSTSTTSSSSSSSSKGLEGLKGLGRLSRSSSRSLWSCSSSSTNSIKSGSSSIGNNNASSSSSSSSVPSPASSCDSIVSGRRCLYPEGVAVPTCMPPVTPLRARDGLLVQRHHVVPDCEAHCQPQQQQQQQQRQEQQEHADDLQPASDQVKGAPAAAGSVEEAQQSPLLCIASHMHSPKTGTAGPEPCSAAARGGAASGPQVLMVLQYRLHLKAMVLPRRMSVVLSVPHTAVLQCACSHTAPAPPPAAAAAAAGSAQHRLESVQHQGQHCWRPGAAPVLTHLENKQPQWNDAQRVWCLNFNGRVKLSSAKNFQLVSAQEDSAGSPQHHAAATPNGHEDPVTTANTLDAVAALTNSSSGGSSSSQAVSMCCCRAADVPGVLRGSPGAEGVVVQFGKTDVNAFILDYDPCVATALQAFAVALTSFGTKLLA